MKKLIVAVAVAFAFNVAAQAGEVVAGGLAIGGQVQTYQGSISGQASSISNGNAVTAAQVGGNGSSYQAATNVTGGQSVVGGGITAAGATVGTQTSQYSTSVVTGVSVGNAPTNVGNSIANGGQAYGNTTTQAVGTTTFAAQQVGGSVAIAGIAGIGSIPAFNGVHGF